MTYITANTQAIANAEPCPGLPGYRLCLLHSLRLAPQWTVLDAVGDVVIALPDRARAIQLATERAKAKETAK